MLKGHYTKAEHIGDVTIPGAHALSFKDPQTLYVSRVIGHDQPATGGITICTSGLELKEFFSNNCSYYGVANGPDGAVAVRNGTVNELEVYSQEPTKVLNYQLPMGKHKGMAMDDKGRVYICDSDSDCVRIYSNTGDLTEVVKHKSLKRPQYIALSAKGLLVTCLGDEPALLHINHDGELLWMYDEFEWPAGVAVDDNNDVYVCDAEEGKVTMVTNDGETSFDMLDEISLKHEMPFSVAVCGNRLAVQLLDTHRVKLYLLTC